MNLIDLPVRILVAILVIALIFVALLFGFMTFVSVRRKDDPDIKVTPEDAISQEEDLNQINQAGPGQ